MSDSKTPVIVWFRQDLRLHDNPALDAAVGMKQPILPIYIMDDENAGDRCPGAASRWWLHQSLESLNDSLDGGLLCFKGNAEEVLLRLAKNIGADAVFWNRCYEPWRIDRDKSIKSKLQKANIAVRSFNGSLLFEPWNITKSDGDPYKVFTPFFRNGCLENGDEPRRPMPAPEDYELYRERGGEVPADLELMPKIDWYEGIADRWTPGENAARKRLDEFLDEGLKHYAEGRDRPDQPFTSKLSPHLHFGEISPNAVWHATRKQGDPSTDENIDSYLVELGWREFSYSLLYYFPSMVTENMQKKFDRFPWREDEDDLRCWQRGQTGYPMVDAGMRELWETGYMHNRVRMITGSFLVKNLMIDWREGERWFWDTLVDADQANNMAGWQWVAGSGADAAPYFRIFNPVSQGRKFDPEGEYIKRYIPELSKLPKKYIHAPWEAPDDVLEEAGVQLGDDYPEPMVEIKASRERALEAFKSISGQ